MGFFIVSGLTSKADERIASGILFTESVLHRRKPYSALSQFWPVGLRAGNDLPRRIRVCRRSEIVESRWQSSCR